MPELEHVDVLIIGAGLSGIGGACQLLAQVPGTSVALLESRAASGGTWDLFKYPGIRSDSDMFTFGYHWRPWPSDTALADGPLILDYLRTVAAEHGVDQLIRYHHQVVGASWDSTTSRWTVDIDRSEPGQQIERVQLTTGLLWSCSGYYDYEAGYSPDFPGQADFEGQIVHPQHWPEDLDYAGKSVVVIGSGATAVTLVPAMAPTAGHVTMLQRTPSYILSRAGRDPVARLLRRLPTRASYPAARWFNILTAIGSFSLSRSRPEVVKRLLRKATASALPDHIDVDKHFKPPYDPWDQRVCFVPDGDLFEELREGNASIRTDHIETFTAAGIRLASGEELEADIIVTATGLQLKAFGGIDLVVDGEPVDIAKTMTYKALMLSSVPNFVYTVGYTNASWTLKADLVGDYVCRLLKHMARTGTTAVVAERDPSVGERPFIDFSSGYVVRALEHLPKQGDREPWALKQNYISDLRTIRKGELDDGVVQFT